MTGKLVTIFGGGGFLGRYVAQELLARGARVRVAERSPTSAVRVKTLGGLGQVQLVAADVTKPDSVQRAVAGADAAINLVGILRGDFDRVHRLGAANVAQAAKAAGIGALVHISAIGADAGSASAYGRSKGDGEVEVRAAFPGAIIIRPSLVFGREDQFTNRFAALLAMAPVAPVLAGATRFQPVYVVDVARAIATATLDPAQFGGKTFELGGPQVMSMRDIYGFLAGMIGRNPALLPVPDALGGALASFTGWMPGAPITRDQWKMLQKDNVVAADAAGLAAFGIAPTPMAAVAESWLVQYRKHGRFAARVRA